LARPKKTKIVFLDTPTVDLGDLDLQALKKLGEVLYLSLTSRDPLPIEIQDAEVVISNKYILGEEQFRLLPKLRLVAVAATGVNNVDLRVAKVRGIGVANAVAYSTTSVVEHALMFLLACAHRLRGQMERVDSGAWSRGPYFADLSYPYADLSGKTLGIVGYGSIGKKVAQAARMLGMKILVAKLQGRKYPAKPARTALKRLLQSSDFVSLHCPLSKETSGLMDREKLSWMKASACLLNLARGPICVEADIADALRKNRLAAYASDVTAQEPPSEDNPLFAEDLRDKTLITPHVAWASRESRQGLVDEIVANIMAFQKGKRRNRVE